MRADHPTMKKFHPRIQKGIRFQTPHKFEVIRMSPFHDYLKPGARVSHFRVCKMIGEGGYGEIYDVVDQRNDLHRALKIEYLDAPKQALEIEIAILRDLQDSPLFPKFMTSGRTSRFLYLVMELLGPSISSVRKVLPSGRYSKYSYMHLAYHSLRTLEQLHAHGIVHRDVKPGNFLIRRDRRNPVVMIDFGLSMRFRRPDGTHEPLSEEAGYTGTIRYSSANAHNELTLSRRDDLISWFYATIELATGDTPWPGNDNPDKALRIKETIGVKRLCAPFPPEFTEIWGMISQLGYEDEPDYHGIRALLRQALSHERFKEHKYDWELLTDDALDRLRVCTLGMGEGIGSDSIAHPDLDWEPIKCACEVM
jgi:serine/threonine protein kinase